MYKHFLATAVLAAALTSAQAQVVIAGWDAKSTATAGYPDAASATAPGVSNATLTPVNMVRGYDDDRNYWGTSSATTTVDPGTTPYLAYSFTLDGTFDLDSFFLGAFAQYDDQAILQLRVNLDGFSTSLGESFSTGSYTNNVFDLSSLGPVSGFVEFRLYVYNAHPIFVSGGFPSFVLSSGGGYGGDPYNPLQSNHNAGVIGSLAAIPEPSTIACFTLGLAALLLIRHLQQPTRR